MSELFARLDRFWNEPIDDRIYGWVRCGFAVVGFLNALFWLASSDELLSASGFNSPEAASATGLWAKLSLFSFVRDAGVIRGLIVLFAFVHVLLFLGIWIRPCLAISWYWHFSYLNWAVLGTAGWDNVLGNICFILLLSPAGRSVRPVARIRSLFGGSGGAVPADGRGAVARSPRYGVYLLRVLVFLIYWETVAVRLFDPYWRKGDAFGYYLLSDFCWFGGEWVLHATGFVKIATWGAMVVEFLIPPLLAFRRTWVAGFILGALFHAALAVTSLNLMLFSLSMVVTYLAFARPREKRSAETVPEGKAEERRS